MMKQKVKNIIAPYFSKLNYPLLINSYGRSGSTVLTKSIIDSAIELNQPKLRNIAFRSISQTAWDLNRTELKPGVVYKTHDYPPNQELRKNIRMVYTFADPVDVVLSLIRLNKEKEEKWMQQHCKHLRVPYDNFQKIVDKDVLHLKDHFESWLSEERFPIAFIKYEKMWEHQDEISGFLNVQIELPEYRERKEARIDDASLVGKLEQTYSSLRNEISQLDSFFINNLKI